VSNIFYNIKTLFVLKLEFILDYPVGTSKLETNI